MRDTSLYLSLSPSSLFCSSLYLSLSPSPLLSVHPSISLHLPLLPSVSPSLPHFPLLFCLFSFLSVQLHFLPNYAESSPFLLLSTSPLHLLSSPIITLFLLSWTCSTHLSLLLLKVQTGLTSVCVCVCLCVCVCVCV